MKIKEGKYAFAYMRIDDNLIDVSHGSHLDTEEDFIAALSKLLSAKIVLPRTYYGHYRPIYAYVDWYETNHKQTIFSPVLKDEIVPGCGYDAPTTGTIVIVNSPALSCAMTEINQGTCFKFLSQSFETDRNLSCFAWEEGCTDVATLCFKNSRIEYSLFVEPIIGIYPDTINTDFNLYLY